MSVEHVGALWGFLGALIGAAASITATLLSLWHSRRLEAERDQRNRAQRDQDSQHQTLLQVQEEILKLSNLSSRTLIRDISAYKGSMRWRMKPTDELHNTDQLDMDRSESLRKCAVLIERVHDDALRAKLTNYKLSMVRMSNAETMQVAEACNKQISEELGILMVEIGERIRFRSVVPT